MQLKSGVESVVSMRIGPEWRNMGKEVLSGGGLGVSLRTRRLAGVKALARAGKGGVLTCE